MLRSKITTWFFIFCFGWSFSARAEMILQSESVQPIEVGYHSEFQTLDNARLWNLLIAGYKVSSNFRVELQAQSYVAFGETTDWTTADPRIGVSGLIFGNGNSFLWANLNVEVPVTDGSRRIGRGFSPGSYQLYKYWFDDSRFNVGAEHWIRFYTYDNDLPWFDVVGNFSPIVSYVTSPRLAAQVRVSMNYQHTKGVDWYGMRGQDVALEPGVSWDLSQNFNVRPYVSIQSVNAPLAGPISAGVWVTGILL